MSIILNIHARQILDSRGNPTVEVDTYSHIRKSRCSFWSFNREHEAVELLVGNDFVGKGVLKAVSNNDTIAQHIVGVSVFEQNAIDQMMIDLDGTPNKSKLGANAILGAFYCSESSSKQLNMPYIVIGGVSANTLPVPMMNIINGGSHLMHLSLFKNLRLRQLRHLPFLRPCKWGQRFFIT